MRDLVSWLTQPRQKLLVSIGWVDMGYDELSDPDTRLPGGVDNESIIRVVHLHDEKRFSRSKGSMPGITVNAGLVSFRRIVNGK